MKYIKRFEADDWLFQIGQYVIGDMNINNNGYKLDEIEFINNNVGIIEEIDDVKPYFYCVRFENVHVISIVDKFGLCPLMANEIRLATPEEIKKQKFINDTNKFNI